MNQNRDGFVTWYWIWMLVAVYNMFCVLLNIISIVSGSFYNVIPASISLLGVFYSVLQMEDCKEYLND